VRAKRQYFGLQVSYLGGECADCCEELGRFVVVGPDRRKIGIRSRGFRSREIPEGVRFAAARLLLHISPFLAGARSESARADSDSREIPEGVRFAGAGLLSNIKP